MLFGVFDMPPPYHSKPSLDNAFARVSRAEEHLARLEVEIYSALKGSIVIASGATGLVTATGYSLPKMIPILIGEVVYNLRAALDYLVFQLVYLDGGKVEKGTKFPIEDDANGWQRYFPTNSAGGSKRRRWKIWITILTPGHQAAIKALQPFNGCGWTDILRKISNPDKHYDLVVINDATISVRITANAALESFAVPPMPDSAVNVQGHVSAIVAFNNGPPVVETLKEIQKEVASVLTSFNHDF